MPRWRSSWSVGLACLLGLAAVRCHPGDEVGNRSDLVGGSCRDDRHCVDRCVEGGDFPGGTCTVPCRDDRDCPDFTWCVDKKGGVCLLDCRDWRDCRPDYDCADTDREGAGGEVRVCIKD